MNSNKFYNSFAWWKEADKEDLKGFLKKAMRRRHKMKLRDANEDTLNPDRKEALDKLMHYRN